MNVQISGTVIDGKTHRPVEEARVVITREEDGKEIASKVISRQGRITFDVLDEYRGQQLVLSVRHRGYRPYERVYQADHDIEVRFRLTPQEDEEKEETKEEGVVSPALPAHQSQPAERRDKSVQQGRMERLRHLWTDVARSALHINTNAEMVKSGDIFVHGHKTENCVIEEVSEGEQARVYCVSVYPRAPARIRWYQEAVYTQRGVTIYELVIENREQTDAMVHYTVYRLG
jgi:hypothetical protein